ncbi:TPA: hypothetical protein N0F65_003913 [Lagenidium giganteum]|uniref:PDZ domain-containing protein n=1 Tax=Lagenidium giganteum TaxID=4803 RepID=A0AAV2Z714_9STRA|nr:TPA: hypothetical protein N0F65_003913 [Lagenidium giganteum]
MAMGADEEAEHALKSRRADTVTPTPHSGAMPPDTLPDAAPEVDDGAPEEAPRKHAQKLRRMWSWTRIDGRNVLAIPTSQEIYLYDSEDFALLQAITDTPHEEPILYVRWSASHAKLASLSASRLVVHAPMLQSKPKGHFYLSASALHAHERVVFMPICVLVLAVPPALSSGMAFSRCTDMLLLSTGSGIQMLDVQMRNDEETEPVPIATRVIWEQTEEKCDMVKFSPSAFVFASLKIGHNRLKVWRMTATSSKHVDLGRKLIKCEQLVHDDPVVYYSWKPATSIPHAACESDGAQAARWFEPQRILLTCTSTRCVRVWSETAGGGAMAHLQNQLPSFVPVLLFEPSTPIDNVRWVLSKNRNISEERFAMLDETREMQMDWISGVDRQGILRLWQVTGLLSPMPTVRQTDFCMKVNGEEDQTDNPSHEAIGKVIKLKEICVMAYFSQNYFGMPSKFDIVLQREDGIILSYNVAVGRTSNQPHIKKKSWYRSHMGLISALAAHPSLPLIASVDRLGCSQNFSLSQEILIYWVSFSAFSAESRLIPSGVLSCAAEHGEVLCVQWIPTLHFEATPLLLVAYINGTIEIYGRAANATGVVGSPRMGNAAKRGPHGSKSPAFSPWTYYDYGTGESGVEYEVAHELNTDGNGLGFDIEVRNNKVVVSALGKNSDGGTPLAGKLVVGDELVGINNKSVIGKDAEGVVKLASIIPRGETVLMRFRANSNAVRQSCDVDSSEQSIPCLSVPDEVEIPSSEAPASPKSVSFFKKFSSTSSPSDPVEDSAKELKEGFMAGLDDGFKLPPPALPSVVHAGAVSLYGGWCQLVSQLVASSLALFCVCPVYADDGDYVPETVVLFAVETLPGKLRAWKGVQTNSSGHLDVTPLHIEDRTVLKKSDITSIAGERDYRQRAFSSQKLSARGGLNSLLFVGDEKGTVQHWRCRVVENNIYFTMMSLYRFKNDSTKAEKEVTSFNRRGYSSAGVQVSARDPSPKSRGAIHQIEVDDPNRIAVLRDCEPDQLHVFEAESGLGILRLEESLVSSGRGNIRGFCWCNTHVEFNIDALAVQFDSGIVIFQYDMLQHRWVQIGDEIRTAYTIFDCTRDSSALLIGSAHEQSKDKAPNKAASNEMPVVLGKWDEPGEMVQYSMDWKAAEAPQKLPVWHPYVVLTTLFGMHARVGVKDTSLESDKPTFSFARGFGDAVQMLKLLSKVIEDDLSAKLSARSGVLSYSVARASTDIVFMDDVGRRDSIGRFSTGVHQSGDVNKAEKLFENHALFSERPRVSRHSADDKSSKRLDEEEERVLVAAIDSLLRKVDEPLRKNASLLFAGFHTEHLLELRAIVDYVRQVQSLGFEMDASAADLGGKRYLSMYIFTKSLNKITAEYIPKESKPVVADSCALFAHAQDPVAEEVAPSTELDEVPSSGVLWALHSDSQQFLCEHCISAQANWRDVRPLWLGLWVRDMKDLRMIVERLAKGIFARTKNAMDVCLYYIALGKKNILMALAKISKSERDKKLATFLENDFSQERWSNAAIKNAYSLLSKKEYETAAAFFLLCEPPRLQEAQRVLAIRHGDASLALVISRLVEYRMSDSFQFDFMSSTATQREICPAGEMTKQLLDQDVIPLFRERNGRWLESCALWWLEDFEQACTVLLPISQSVDVLKDYSVPVHVPQEAIALTKSATNFYINLTSIPIYFQFLHSSTNAPLIAWGLKKLRQSPGTRPVGSPSRTRLASPTDIEHAYSFAAYVCKRSGLSDTALIDMLQARHLVNIHSRFELSTMEADPASSTVNSLIDDAPTSPRFSSMRNVRASATRSPKMLCEVTPWSSSPRRMSDMLQRDPIGLTSPKNGDSHSLHRSKTTHWSQLLSAEKPIPTAPWLKAQIADIECRRWASSAFVGKMIGIRVAREMITHFRAEFDAYFRHFKPGKRPRTEKHKDFLEELCSPLCEQFQVDQKYVLESALAVMQPHAYLHIAEVSFLLSELGRTEALRKWIQYIALSMLHSCSTCASCEVTDDIYRDWESLTIQLCYLLNLDAQGQIDLPYPIIATVSVAVRTGVIFLGWCRDHPAIVREAISIPFYSKVGAPANDEEVNSFFAELSEFSFDKNLELVRMLQEASGKRCDQRSYRGNFGYVFLGTVASYLSKHKDDIRTHTAAEDRHIHHHAKLQKMFSLILMVSILRTLYARAQIFLTNCDAMKSGEQRDELDISSSLFTPRKLWRSMCEGPLDGIRRWYTLIESHLRCEFDYSIKEVTCLCGLYGLDGASVEVAARVQAALYGTDKCSDTESVRKESVNSEDIDFEGREEDHHHHFRNIFHKHPKASTLEESILKFLTEVDISVDVHKSLLRTSDDYIILLMRHPRHGVRTSLRRFRVDPRVHMKCFLLKDAFYWFASAKIFATMDDAHAFLSRCCKERKLRLLVKHRGQNAHHFPGSHAHMDEASASDGGGEETIMNKDLLYHQAMMFVDPWEVEAESNSRVYMHNGLAPLHMELGWDRLSPICSETCDEIISSVFQNQDLLEMWRATCGEGWLVTSITQYQLDGVHSRRSGHVHTKCVFEEEHKVPYLVEIHSRSQRNAMFKEVGLPHRFLGVIKVSLLEAKDLISCNWIGHSSEPYVFFGLSKHRNMRMSADTWSLQTYRSRVGVGGLNPKWGGDEDEFTFRFAIPTHHEHVHAPIRSHGSFAVRTKGGSSKSSRSQSGDHTASNPDAAEEFFHDAAVDANMAGIWDADEPHDPATATALESLFQAMFRGPPMLLHFSAFHKNKVMAHQFMGSGKIPLNELTSGNPIEAWVPLEGVPSGSLHVLVSLSFQLVCSSVAASEETAAVVSFVSSPTTSSVSAMARSI